MSGDSPYPGERAWRGTPPGYARFRRMLLFLSYRQRQRLKMVPGVLELQYCALKQSRKQIARESSQICAEGFPRSGTTFFHALVLHGLRVAPERVSGHAHAIANIRRALRLRVPTFVVVREPIDCSLSLLAAGHVPDLNDALGAYYDFHRSLLSAVDRLTIVPFETLIQNPYGVLRAIAARTGHGLTGPVDAVVPSAIENRRRLDRAEHGDDFMHDSLPNAARAARKAELFVHEYGSEAQRLVERCSTVRMELLTSGSAVDVGEEASPDHEQPLA